MATDWLVFQLAADVAGQGELEESVVARLERRCFSAVEKLAKEALPGGSITVSPNGARLSDASAADALRLAVALEPRLGSVGIAQVSTNEWWDRGEFELTRLPLG